MQNKDTVLFVNGRDSYCFDMLSAGLKDKNILSIKIDYSDYKGATDCGEKVDRWMRENVPVLFRQCAKVRQKQWMKKLKGDGESRSVYGKKLFNAVRRFNPDMIVCADEYALKYTLNARVKEGFYTPVAMVITDYVLDCRKADKRADYFIVENETVKMGLKELGIGSERVFVAGMPVKSGIRIRENAKEFYGLDKNPVIVITGGIRAEKGLVRITQRLTGRFGNGNFFVLCGDNEKVFRQVSALKVDVDSIRVLKKTDDLGTVYSAADVVVAQAGARTMREAMCFDVPVVAVDRRLSPSSNSYLKDAGAVVPATENTVAEETERLLNDAEEREVVTSAAKKLLDGEPNEKILRVLSEIIADKREQSDQKN